LDAHTGKEVQRFLGHKGSAPGVGPGVYCLAFSSDGKTLVSRAADDTVRVWQVATGKEVRRFKLAGLLYSLALYPDGKTIAAGGDPEVRGELVNADVHIWETATGKEVRRLPHPGPANVTFSPDGKTLAAGPGGVVLWEVGTWRKLRTLGPSDDLIYTLAFSPDGKTIAVGTNEETYFLDTETGKKRADIKRRESALTFTPDGKTLLLLSSDAYD